MFYLFPVLTIHPDRATGLTSTCSYEGYLCIMLAISHNVKLAINLFHLHTPRSIRYSLLETGHGIVGHSCCWSDRTVFMLFVCGPCVRVDEFHVSLHRSRWRFSQPRRILPRTTVHTQKIVVSSLCCTHHTPLLISLH